MNRKEMFQLLILLLYIALYFDGCANLLRVDDVAIVGRVKLSDNPSSGYGGITVSTENESTTTDREGKFRIEGSIFANVTIIVYFEKSGYATKHVEIDDGDFEFFSEKYPPYICDLGDIILTKIEMNTK